MSKYDTQIDLTNQNTSHALMVELIGSNKRVLDVGCSTGYLARVLVERGCTVSGVEYAAKAAEEARPFLHELVIDDLERMDVSEAFDHGQFDVVVYGDVLEHLRDPVPTLRQARPLLKPGGSVVLSVPNIGHGAVRLALLRGRFEYRSLGLLDNTHLRFFTRASLEQLLNDAGFVPVDLRRTTAGLFETELGVKPEDYDQAIVDELLLDPEATTYQFVVRAARDDAEQAISELAARAEAQHIRLLQLEAQLSEAEREREELRGELERARSLLDVAENEHAAEVAGLRHELELMRATKTMRLTRAPRAVYSALRSLTDRQSPAQ